jgi:ABC-type glutathione transport system ATPase component
MVTCSEPRILILDEATSSVDSESELAIQGALTELVKGRTSIIIAHRLSTLRNCDRIMVVEEGRLVEQGTHAELMQLDGKYAKLVKIQTSVSKSDTIDTINAHEEEEKKLGGAEVAPELVVDKDTKLTPITGHRPRWLRPRFARIHLGNRGSLHVTIQNERIYDGVFALRCMPVRYPNEYLSLRWFNADNREQEIGLIRDLSEWPEESQKLINESLVRRYFVHTIQRIESIERLQNYLNFHVQTDLGPMEFFMRWSYDTAHDYADRGKVLLDVEENRYVVPDVSKLPYAERKLFERWIYW